MTTSTKPLPEGLAADLERIAAMRELLQRARDELRDHSSESRTLASCTRRDRLVGEIDGVLTTSTKQRTTPMSTIEEMVETAEREINADGEINLRAALSAVIEKHVGPLLADAFANGQIYVPTLHFPATTPKLYAARILSALTATGRE